MNSVLCSLLCVYAFIKFLCGYTADNNFQQSSKQKRFYLRFIFITLTLLTCLFTACSLLPLLVFYNMVDVYLRVRLGSAYGGMLKRQDSGLHSIRDKAVINKVFILNKNKHSEDIWKFCLEKGKNLFLSSYKLSSTIRNCSGYYYYHKDQIKFEDVVEKRTIGDGEYITRSVLLDYIHNLPRLQDEKRLWSLAYFPQPILWNNNSKRTEQYAIILSFQHCLADGPNSMKHFMKHFLDDSYKPPESNSLINLKNMPKFSIDDAYIFENPFSRSQTDGFPKLNKNIQEQYFAICSEDTEKYLNLIKKVKNKLGVGFNGVIVGALSNSLIDHLKKKQQPSRDMVFLTTIRPEEINLVFKSNDKDPLTNDVGHQLINIHARHSALSINETLQSINERLKRIRQSVDSTMLYMLSKFAHILPSIAVRMILEKSSRGVTLVATNMSGVKNLTFAGHAVEGTLFFISHFQDIPFTFCIISLNGRLQLSLGSSGRYVSGREELQQILDGTLRSIDQFAEELELA